MTYCPNSLRTTAEIQGPLNCISSFLKHKKLLRKERICEEVAPPHIRTSFLKDLALVVKRKEISDVLSEYFSKILK